LSSGLLVPGPHEPLELLLGVGDGDGDGLTLGDDDGLGAGAVVGPAVGVGVPVGVGPGDGCGGGPRARSDSCCESPWNWSTSVAPLVEIPSIVPLEVYCQNVQVGQVRDVGALT
jgi:hypothetical protein